MQLGDTDNSNNSYNDIIDILHVFKVIISNVHVHVVCNNFIFILQGPELSLLSVFITDNMDVLLQNTTNIGPNYHSEYKTNYIYTCTCYILCVLFIHVHVGSIGCDAPNVYFLKKVSQFDYFVSLH